MLLLILAMLSEAVFFALALVPVLFYTRLRREKVLDQFTRGQIFGYIMAYPGSTYRGIKRGLGLNNGTLTYHLYTLERERFVRSRADGVYKRFYPIDVRIPDDAGESVTPFQRALWNLVSEEPGISQTEAAERLGTKKQNVYYNAKRLQRAGLLRITKSNGRTMLHPGARAPSDHERAAAHAVSSAASVALGPRPDARPAAAIMGARDPWVAEAGPESDGSRHGSEGIVQRAQGTGPQAPRYGRAPSGPPPPRPRPGENAGDQQS
jgi:DNA-binding MarR family transcriptional regulator